MDEKTIEKIVIGTGVTFLAGVVGVNLYLSHRWNKLTHEIRTEFPKMQAESRRATEETLRNARRVFKAADAQMSDYEDIINGKIPPTV